MVTIAWNDAVTKLAYALCKSVWNDGRVLALAITKTMQLCQREWREAVKTSLAKGNRPKRIHIAFDIHTYVNLTDVRSNLASNIPFTMEAQQRFYDSGKCSSSEQRIVVAITALRSRKENFHWERGQVIQFLRLLVITRWPAKSVVERNIPRGRNCNYDQLILLLSRAIS